MYSNQATLLKKVGTAALTSVVFFYTFVYINQGTIWLWDSEIRLELFFTFLFLITLFWIHGLISRAFSAKPLADLPAKIKALMEGCTVVAASMLICYLVYFVPYVYFFHANDEIELIPVRTRLAYVVSSIISLFFYYFVERERSRKRLEAEFLRAEQLQKENFKAQLESLKNQVNPHFLFNSLNVLNSLIYADQDKAAQFLSQLSEVYRAILNSSDKQLVPLKKEIELVNSYIYLMETRFGNKIQFELNVPAETLELELPPTSVQMLIENAIKHNGSTSQKQLLIQVFVDDDKLVVQNNLQPRLDEVKSNKIGLKNICSRYSYLTDKQVEIEQTEEKFIVRLPLLSVEKYENSYH